MERVEQAVEILRDIRDQKVSASMTDIVYYADVLEEAKRLLREETREKVDDFDWDDPSDYEVE